MNEIRGYKVFNSDWTCRGFQYEVGKTYTMEEKPVICKTGFHFCRRAVDCFKYYQFDLANKVAEIVALGEIDEQSDDAKICTNKIKIVRKLDWNEVFDIVNTGNGNSGIGNSGSHNSGNYNTGRYNSGSRNSGHYNIGDRNSGDHNIGSCNFGSWNRGDCNSGYYNIGDYNSGSWNRGNCNSGDWNATNDSSGCFNTEEQTIMMFNKPTDMTYKDWFESEARELLFEMPRNSMKWTYKENMSDGEKEHNPSCGITGGYLKVLDNAECAQIWWDKLEEEERNIIRAIPNFDADIFLKCTGIDVNK